MNFKLFAVFLVGIASISLLANDDGKKDSMVDVSKKKTVLKNSFFQLVVGPTAAGVITYTEKLLNKNLLANDNDFNNFVAGPLGSRQKVLALNTDRYPHDYYYHYGYCSDKFPNEMALNEIYKKNILDESQFIRLKSTIENHYKLKSYIINDLPKTFYRYAFYRNLALIWGGMHLYNTYKGTQ